MSLNLNKVAVYGLFVFSLLAVLSGIKEFHLWSQVESLWLADSELEFGIRFIYGNPHALRYILVFPIYAIAEYLNIEPNLLFSVLAIFIILLISKLLTKTLLLLGGTGNKWAYQLPIFALFLSLSIFMNGRLVFAFLSYSLFIYLAVVLIKDHKSNAALYFVVPAIFFSSVSSGIAISLFVIMSMYFFSYFIAGFLYKRKKLPVLSIVFLIVVFVLYIPIILALVFKNLNYFGTGPSSVLHMLGHAPVDSISDLVQDKSDLKLTLFAVFRVLLFGFVILFVKFHKNTGKQEVIVLFLSFLMLSILWLSFFAYSILMMAFVPLVVIALLVLNDDYWVRPKAYFMSVYR